MQALSRLQLQDQVSTIIQLKYEQLRQDNMALVNEIYRLRQIIGYYELKVVELQKNEAYHKKQIEILNENTKNILERLQKSDQHTSQQISESIKKLKKQMLYKRVQALQSKYEKKREQCEELLTFKNKIERLRLSWDLKCKDKSLQSLFVWVYNQIVKGKGCSPIKSKKSQKSIKGKNLGVKQESQIQSIKIDKKSSEYFTSVARNTYVDQGEDFEKTNEEFGFL